MLKRLHSVNKKAEDNYECTLCDLTYKTSVKLKAHIEKDHKSKHSLKLLKCNQCDSKFKLPADLQNHTENNHESKTLKSILKKS